MVLSSLGRITGGAIRELARNLFPAFYERGLSANQALKQLREQGLGYRRQDFLSDFRQGEGAFSQYTKVRYVNEGKIPSEGILEGKYHGVPDKYSFLFRAEGEDPQTGDPTERYFFYHRGTLDTRGNMESEAAEWFSSKSDAYGIDVGRVAISEGYINPLWA